MPVFLGRLSGPLDDQIAGTKAGITELHNVAVDMADRGEDVGPVMAQIASQNELLARLQAQRGNQGPPAAQSSMDYAPNYAQPQQPAPIEGVQNFLTAALQTASTVISTTKGAQQTSANLAQVAQYGMYALIALAFAGAYVLTNRKK